MKTVHFGLFMVICLCTRPLAGMAQFSDSVNYYVNFAGTGNLNRTNTGTTYLLNNVLRFQVDKKKFSVNSLISHLYGQNPVSKTNDDFFTIINVDLLKGVQKFYYWALADYEKSFSLKVDNRFQAGAGVGYSFVKNANANLELSDGLLFETVDLSIPDQRGQTSYQIVRNSARLKYRFIIKGIFRFEGTNFYQPSLSDGSDYILKLNNNFSVNLYKWLHLTTSFNYNRQNITSTENLFLSYGLMVEKYF
ncbi:hypothetical protein A3860_11445 [Niastella vici]|uniref:DUF481 domain-containing protein n=1 Tax=Niastella vici TaxID=1703345 RepID=A0A1V9FFR3_9BACT|nr:DUF481 domain-containing protein [Niastella vici]OQP57170.1 hypothetical protein A3860_11445 [Niastella vici]